MSKKQTFVSFACFPKLTCGRSHYDEILLRRSILHSVISVIFFQSTRSIDLIYVGGEWSVEAVEGLKSVTSGRVLAFIPSVICYNIKVLADFNRLGEI